MKKVKDEYGYYFTHENEKGWKICLERVMFGTRVNIYFDDTTLNGSYCGGSNPMMVEVLWTMLYKFVATNTDHMNDVCRELSHREKLRPFGQDDGFVDAVSNLPKSKGEVPVMDFGLQANDFADKIKEMLDEKKS